MTTAEELALEREKLELERERLALERAKLEAAEKKAKRRRKKSKGSKSGTGEVSKRGKGSKTGTVSKRKSKGAKSGTGKVSRSKDAKSKESVNAESGTGTDRASPPRKLPVGLIALAVITGLTVGVGVFLASQGDGETDVAASPAPSAPGTEGAPSAPREVDASKAPANDHAKTPGLSPAELVDKAERLLDLEPETARRLLERVQAGDDVAASARAAKLLAQLQHRQRQEDIAKKTADGEAEQAAWEAGAEERAEKARERDEIAAQVRLLDRVKAASQTAKTATTPAALRQVEDTLTQALTNPACDEQVQYAVDDAREVVRATRQRLGAALSDAARELSAQKKFKAALAKLAQARKLFGTLPADLASLERETKLASERQFAELKAERERAAAEAKADAARAEAAAAETEARHARARERIEKEVTKRAESWFKARRVKDMLCRDCEGDLVVRCGPCKGREVIPCLQCRGSGAIIVFGEARGITSRGGRGRRIKQTCPRCRGVKTEDCPKCTDGTNVCECKSEHRGALAGFRFLACKRAFWDYLSPSGRSGWKKDELLAEVGRRKELRGQLGRTLDVHRATVESVKVLADRVVVTARVQWHLSEEQIADGVKDEELSKSTWIRARGKFYLLTERDTPEKLFED